MKAHFGVRWQAKRDTAFRMSFESAAAALAGALQMATKLK